ncbi:MAG TPA: hypothetical protein V6D20_06645 [Candidatus Obscuribacterales bacterium]
MRQGKFEFGDEFAPVSQEAKDFIQSCLQVDPTQRPKAKDLAGKFGTLDKAPRPPSKH